MAHRVDDLDGHIAPLVVAVGDPRHIGKPLDRIQVDPERPVGVRKCLETGDEIASRLNVQPPWIDIAAVTALSMATSRLANAVLGAIAFATIE